MNDIANLVQVETLLTLDRYTSLTPIINLHKCLRFSSSDNAGTLVMK